LRVEDKKDELSALVSTGNRTDENFDEMFIKQLDNESRVRAEISKRLQIPVDAIDVTIDDISGIRAARVFFSPSDVSRMTGL
jgi:ppGpp synthetase/RelA/SpoT-type nucleotidyltranferase